MHAGPLPGEAVKHGIFAIGVILEPILVTGICLAGGCPSERGQGLAIEMMALDLRAVVCEVASHCTTSTEHEEYS